MQGSGKSETTTQISTRTPPAPSSYARLLVVDDFELLRESMSSMVETEPDLWVVDEAKDGQEAIELCHQHHPDLVLMDARIPKMNGFEAARLIKEELPETKVLIVSTYENPALVSKAMRVGAEGYIIKLAPLEEILQAIRGILVGEHRYP